MSGVSLGIAIETFPFAAPFRISGYVFDRQDVIVVTLADGEHVGRGEASGVYYLGENAASMAAQVEAHRALIESGVSRELLRDAMPAGGARHAVDAAMWDLEAKRAGQTVWELAGLGAPAPLATTFTIGAEEPAEMARRASAFADVARIKIKLTGELRLDIARVRAIRAARPDAWLGVDGNQGFSRKDLAPLIAALVEEKVSLIEQPVRRGREPELDGIKCPVPVAADESVLTLDEISRLVGRFDVVNIKLDKCGGLTEGLEMVKQARLLGLGVMVGCMVGSSLGMAPAFVLGQLCDIIDLDGPIFLARDRVPSIEYVHGQAWCPDDLWGYPTRCRAAA
ncbi:dipeptide epimerase [Sphingomonas sp. LaA6.9]|uniref:dipeptide epimerase n=1 Tax=Sphingomonas sp. LaA6.9 TaxID=2919914 RepID=UPI001F4F3F44|nr:dipeptide epimerase [Sphingomonas sp. LaA6.9]MCJ8156583.1 dipeptide epimerase [Sphingomonas sp. LaA6.9]